MTLEQRIQQKIEEASPMLDQLPGVAVIHNIRDFNVVYMSPRGYKPLNVTLEEIIAMGGEYHTRFFNQEDAKDYVPKLAGMLERNNNEEIVSFFQQVRPSEQADWQWHLSSIKIFMWDDEGQPLLTLTIAMPIDPQHHITSKVERLLEENNFLRRQKDLFAALTRREKQILALMARDKTSLDISKELFLSEETVKTHRRNIKKKIAAQNQYDVIKFAQAFDII